MRSNPSLASQQRANVMRAYRHRGHKNRQVYLVYSVKTDRDWILPSSRQFLHWIIHLETDRKVESFEICSDEPCGNEQAEENLGIDAKAHLQNGKTLWHKVVADDVPVNHDETALRTEPERPALHVFTEAELRAQAVFAMRWLKVICFASALRGQRQMPLMSAVAQNTRSIGNGTVRDILKDMAHFDDATVKGVIARLAIKGSLVLDLSTGGYTMDSPWRWGGPE